jgi:hypothetical protein
MGDTINQITMQHLCTCPNKDLCLHPNCHFYVKVIQMLLSTIFQLYCVLENFFLMGETSIQVQIPELLKYITWLDNKWTWHVFCQKQERLTLHKHLRSKRFFWVGSTVLPIFLVFCIMFFFYILLVSGAQCCLCLLIAPSVFSNVYSWASCFMLDEWFMLSLEIRLTVAIYFVIHDINLVINSMWTSSLECWTKS